MKKRYVVPVIIGVLCLFVGAGLYAGTKVQDVIKMESKGYDARKKGTVEFTHKKHATDYKITCGECHHDKDGKPLQLKEGDAVQTCIECHKKPGEKPKGKDAPKLTQKEELQYHAEAMHQNCIGCHKEVNKKSGKKDAPETCAKCHPKKAGEKE